jgi:hypothetical protein
MTTFSDPGPGPDNETAKEAIARTLEAIDREKCDVADYIASATLEKAARDIDVRNRTAEIRRKAACEVIDLRRPFKDDVDRYIAEALLDRLCEGGE